MNTARQVTEKLEQFTSVDERLRRSTTGALIGTAILPGVGTAAGYGLAKLGKANRLRDHQIAIQNLQAKLRDPARTPAQKAKYRVRIAKHQKAKRELAQQLSRSNRSKR